MELTAKAKQQLVDMISRSAQVLIAHGEDFSSTMDDVRSANVKLAFPDFKPITRDYARIPEDIVRERDTLLAGNLGNSI